MEFIILYELHLNFYYISLKLCSKVQVRTEGKATVGGDWQFHMEPKPVQSFKLNPNKFEPRKHQVPWYIEPKMTNWSIGDYIKLHIIMHGLANIVLYRGYPKQIGADFPHKRDYKFFHYFY